MSGSVITPEQATRILLHSRVQAVVLVRVAERLLQLQPLVLMGGSMRLLHVDVRCIMKVDMPNVARNSIIPCHHVPPEVIITYILVVSVISGQAVPPPVVVVVHVAVPITMHDIHNVIIMAMLLSLIHI